MNDAIPLHIGRSSYGDFSINIKPHTWVVGQSGVGKSTLLANAFVSLLQREYGGIFLDPHGTAVAQIAKFIPRHRTNDVIWIDATADRANQIVNLSNYQFVTYNVKNGLPLSSGVIDAKAKVRKLGGEPPARAVIAESLRRWGAPKSDIDRKMLEFLGS